MKDRLDPQRFVISRKRKKYKFALFHNNPLCFEADEWPKDVQPDVLEIGAGTALFSNELARRQPTWHFLAVDVKADRLQKGAEIAQTEGLQNIHFLRARVDQLPGLFAPGSLKSIWITFPDPFPKDRAAKHRLTHPAFLAIYKELLSEDGTLYVKTDAKKLFEWSLEQFVHAGWVIQSLSFDLHDSTLPETYKIMTTYERRFVSEGMVINFVAAKPPYSSVE